MDKIVVLILTIAVTLCLFSFSVMEEASNAKEVMSLVDREQNEIAFMIENPDLVTSTYVLDYLMTHQETRVYNGTKLILEDQIENYRYYRMQKFYESNGEISLTFHAVEDPYIQP